MQCLGLPLVALAFRGAWSQSAPSAVPEMTTRQFVDCTVKTSSPPANATVTLTFSEIGQGCCDEAGDWVKAQSKKLPQCLIGKHMTELFFLNGGTLSGRACKIPTHSASNVSFYGLSSACCDFMHPPRFFPPQGDCPPNDFVERIETFLINDTLRTVREELAQVATGDEVVQAMGSIGKRAGAGHMSDTRDSSNTYTPCPEYHQCYGDQPAGKTCISCGGCRGDGGSPGSGCAWVDIKKNETCGVSRGYVVQTYFPDKGESCCTMRGANAVCNSTLSYCCIDNEPSKAPYIAQCFAESQPEGVCSPPRRTRKRDALIASDIVLV
jgi:hypothetical protein